MEDTEEIFADPDERVDYLTKGGDIFKNYGWFIFAGVMLIALVWPRIQRFLDKMYQKYEARRYDAKYHKNPDLALERLEGLHLARQRMQDELNKKTAEYEEKKREKEAQKLQELLASTEGKESGYRLSDGASGSSPRPEYNPLMGDSARGYRATKRKGCPGGGCGR